MTNPLCNSSQCELQASRLVYIVLAFCNIVRYAAACNKIGTREGTSPCDQVPSCVLPIFIKNLVAGTKIWSLRLVPRIQTWLEFVGQVPGTCPRKLCWSLRVNCSWDKSLRPNENKPIADQYFCSQNPSRTPFQDGGRR